MEISVRDFMTILEAESENQENFIREDRQIPRKESITKKGGDTTIQGEVEHDVGTGGAPFVKRSQESCRGKLVW